MTHKHSGKNEHLTAMVPTSSKPLADASATSRALTVGGGAKHAGGSKAKDKSAESVSWFDSLPEWLQMVMGAPLVLLYLYGCYSAFHALGMWLCHMQGWSDGWSQAIGWFGIALGYAAIGLDNAAREGQGSTGPGEVKAGSAGAPAGHTCNAHSLSPGKTRKALSSQSNVEVKAPRTHR